MRAAYRNVITVVLVIMALWSWSNGEKVAGSLTTSVECSTSGTIKTDAVDTLVVVCRLVEIPGRFVENDAYDYVYVMKYRVLSVEKGTYEGKEMLVGHYNPLIPRKMIQDRMDRFVGGTVEKFVLGEKHRLKLVYPVELLWNGAVEDEYYDTDLKKYFAIEADIVK